MYRKLLIITLACLLLVSSFVGGCASKPATPAPSAQPASKYPEKEITIVCGFGPGASGDLVTRAMAAGLTKYLGKNVVVLNQEGSGGVLAATQLKSAKPDGYTISMGVAGFFTAQPIFNKTLGYKQDDFEFLGTACGAPGGIIVNAKSPYKTVADLVKAGKAGKVITYGNPGANSTPMLVGAQFFSMAGIKNQQIPFAGGGPAMTALLGDKVDTLSLIVSDVISQVQGGTMRVLAVAADKRLDVLPDVPTMKEAGYDYVLGSTWFVFAPKGLPQDVKTKLADAVEKLTKDADFIAAMKKQNIQVKYMNEKDMLADFEKQKAIIQKLADAAPKS